MPPSIAIYGRDFAALRDQGNLFPDEFRYRFLAEGDSWMDRSSALAASLPDHLADVMNDHGESALIVNLSMFGDTMRRIGSVVGGEFASWLDFMRFDAILLSAGGNDFIDAARDPGPGQGLLRDMRGQPLPPRGYDCVRTDALARLVTDYLDPSFAQLYDAVRASSRNAATPILLNNYDTPVARKAPALPGGPAWLHAAYTKNGIDPSLWPDLTGGIFNDIQTTIAGWQQGRAGLVGVPTDGRLVAADPASPGESGDWVNEIHPNRAGWRKLARVWREELLKVV